MIIGDAMSEGKHQVNALSASFSETIERNAYRSE
jgi:hypothetical protein